MQLHHNCSVLCREVSWRQQFFSLAAERWLACWLWLTGIAAVRSSATTTADKYVDDRCLSNWLRDRQPAACRSASFQWPMRMSTYISLGAYVRIRDQHRQAMSASRSTRLQFSEVALDHTTLLFTQNTITPQRYESF
jgi:hypothetical protein